MHFFVRCFCAVFAERTAGTKSARIERDPGAKFRLGRLLFQGNRLLGLLRNAFRCNAIGFEHLRCLTAAAKLIVDAVAHDGDRVSLAQELSNSGTKEKT